MTEIDQLKFDEKGLIPAVIVEAGTHRLLMVAYMNRESLKISMETGKTCFFNPVYQSEEKSDFTLDALMELIRRRKTNPQEGSYTTYLFRKGLDKILKKIGEESTEVIIAAKDNDPKETIYEISDLVYHVMVMMIQQGIPLEDIRRELASRHVIDHKVKQEKSRAE